MKRLAFVVGGAAALALASCGGSNQDAVQNAELNQATADELNQLSNEAAMNAAEDAALGNQQQQLEDQNAAAEDNAVNPTDADEQNVSGM